MLSQIQQFLYFGEILFFIHDDGFPLFWRKRAPAGLRHV
ncbi:hypothetical protein yberc0001_28490 [Yersinia bercovieri ATCC 43970]|uniref:Uncharacterized protein n=1 Tax=Yersinia bercovieri ATCC 43970 TaxID=349968 RepID=A0ABM9XWX2_YERBE|nr:hypothetical protein yberc0001_28490 [Yersinia bercovieri ATCC 43970]